MPAAAPPDPAATLKPRIAAELESLRAIRRDLHAHPELGYHERRTSALVQAELTRLGIAHVANLAGGTGIVAYLPPTDPAARTSTGAAVALRADMDALPIVEQTGLDYASRTPGVMHACGHDGHTTILLGAARILRALPRPRAVTLLFQPAEEGGGGAERLCAEGALDGSLIGVPVAQVFGLHGWPQLPLGSVGTRPGPLLAATDEFRVTIHGVQSHGAQPHFGRDPIVAAAHCIVALQTVVSRSIAPTEACVVTVGVVNAGTASNIIPQSATFVGTIRTLDAAVRATAQERLRQTIEHAAAALGCRAEIDLVPGYPVTRNDPALTARFFEIARAALPAASVELIPSASMGGEDFAYYAERVPGVFYFLGLKPQAAAAAPALHQPDFDFNDDALPLGIEMMCRLALEA
ncbi:M20 aminoacylase family protein [soil metagenome]